MKNLKIAKVVSFLALALVVAGAAVFVLLFEKKTAFAEKNKAEQVFDFRNDKMPWEETRAFSVPEFPGVSFKWTSSDIFADGESLYYGMPVWSVYLTDLNGDGLREIVSEASMGSGIVDQRVYAYDYADKKCYVLENRFVSDFSLFIKDGELWVSETERYPFEKSAPISERKLDFSEMKSSDGKF